MGSRVRVPPRSPKEIPAAQSLLAFSPSVSSEKTAKNRIWVHFWVHVRCWELKPANPPQRAVSAPSALAAIRRPPPRNNAPVTCAARPGPLQARLTRLACGCRLSHGPAHGFPNPAFIEQRPDPEVAHQRAAGRVPGRRRALFPARRSAPATGNDLMPLYRPTLQSPEVAAGTLTN